jgi:Yip1 domain
MSDPHEQSFQAPPPPPLPESATAAPRPTKMRPIAIGLFVVGLLICAGGAVKVIPGGLITGAAVAFLGIVFFALSFIPLPEVAALDEQPLSTVQKLTGIFFEPTRVFRNLRAHPNWVAAYIVIAVLSAAYTFAFTQRVTPERIVNYTLDKVAEMGPPFAPSPERLERMRATQIEDAKNSIQQAGTVIKTFVGTFVVTAALGALYLLGVLAFGGRINFWQALAVTFYAVLPVVVIQRVLSLVILYLKAPEDIHPILGRESLVQDNLGVLVTPAVHPVLFVVATSIGVLSFYGLWLKATGLRNGGTRVSKGVAWGVAVTMWVLGLLLAMAASSLFSGFMS